MRTEQWRCRGIRVRGRNGAWFVPRFAHSNIGYIGYDQIKSNTKT